MSPRPALVIVDDLSDPARAGKFYSAIRRYWPHLQDDALQPTYSGIGPKTTGPRDGSGDFIIQGSDLTGHQSQLALYAIESFGFTASLAIADEVWRKLAD